MSGLAIASSNGIDEKIVSVGVSYSTNVPAGTSVPMEWDTYIIDELAGAAFDVVNFYTFDCSTRLYTCKINRRR